MISRQEAKKAIAGKLELADDEGDPVVVASDKISKRRKQEGLCVVSVDAQREWWPLAELQVRQ